MRMPCATDDPNDLPCDPSASFMSEVPEPPDPWTFVPLPPLWPLAPRELGHCGREAQEPETPPPKRIGVAGTALLLRL